MTRDIIRRVGIRTLDFFVRSRAPLGRCAVCFMPLGNIFAVENATGRRMHINCCPPKSEPCCGPNAQVETNDYRTDYRSRRLRKKSDMTDITMTPEYFHNIITDALIVVSEALGELESQDVDLFKINIGEARRRNKVA